MILEREIHDWLAGIAGGQTAEYLTVPALVVAVGLIAWASYLVFHHLFIPLITKLVKRTETEWDDDILTPGVLRAVSQLVPALIVAWLLPQIFESDKTVYRLIDRATSLYIVIAVMHMVFVVIGALFHAFAKRDSDKVPTLKGIFQMLRLIVVAVGIIICSAILFGRPVFAILTAIGASAAVLMLVFKDTILGLVAGVQLTANNMLHKGDWIVCERAGANGEVIDISLTTVKVLNWDNTVVTIPPYNLISDSFQNYEAMRDMGGRRICRSVCIDVNSVRFLNAEEIADLDSAGMLKGIDPERTETTINLGLFRRHLVDWLTNHRDVIEHKGRTMFIMVREMQSTPEGIPLQLYFFTDKVSYPAFEEVQSDIFDYVYAAAPRFGLRIYQAPSGTDLRSLAR